MIDYSKFDNIELSDDSDVEVHPNVDKTSFIRWKQRDIHEKRAQRNAQINQITINLQMYSHLNDRVDAILKESGVNLGSEADAFAFLNAKFDKNEMFQSELVNPDENVPYNEQIEDLIIQLKHEILKEGKEVNDEVLREKLALHKEKIDNLLKEQKVTLAKLEEEKASHIESEDLKEGFSSSFINKGSSSTNNTQSTAPSNNGNTSASTIEGQTQVIETIKTPKPKPNPSAEPTPSKPLNQLDELELLDETNIFKDLPQNDSIKIHNYLAQHLYIITEQQKDALLMTAFDAELSDNYKEAQNIVYKAMLLRFLDELLKPIPNKEVKLTSLNSFMSKIKDHAHPASKAFLQEVAFTYNHIKNRCKVIREEESKRKANSGVEGEGADDDEEEALIQLKSTDDNTTLTVDLPTEDDTERYELFQQLPEELRKALETENMDEVNKVFATMKLKEAEDCLEVMNIAGIIGVEVLENEQEFEELKKNLHKSNLEEIEELDDNDDNDEDVVVHEPVEEVEVEQNTADLVD